MPTPCLPPRPEPALIAPVLLIVFNRPHPTRRVFEAVRRARPARLYVAADGPRPDRPTDAARCAETRILVTEGVDWPCEVHTLFRTENRGCGWGPAEAINWFFEQEPEGIILEDDCLPSASFFRFCQETLARYRHDSRVMHIAGGNFSFEARQPAPAGANSYHFSGRVHSWGWASWQRAWQHFDFNLTNLPELRRNGVLARHYSSLLERAYWLHKFEKVRAEKASAHIWDYQWHFAVAAQRGLTIVPAVNLMTNIGFGDDATHTVDSHAQRAHPAAGEMTFPLRHPAQLVRDQRRDGQYFREHLIQYALTTTRRFLSWLLPTKAILPPPAAPGVASTSLAQPTSVLS